MQFDIVTLFPEMFAGVFSESIIKRASEKKLLDIKLHDLRKFTLDKYGTVDDKPFGGGVGMVIKVDVVDRSLEQIKKENLKLKKTRVIALSARGKRFCQKDAERLAQFEQITLICGHYEGLDARIEEELADEMISIGDFVLTGGEIAAMVIVDSVARLKAGVLGKDMSSDIESFSKKIQRKAEYPQYTRPEVYKTMKVPEVLLSGNHKKIEEWQRLNCK